MHLLDAAGVGVEHLELDARWDGATSSPRAGTRPSSENTRPPSVSMSSSSSGFEKLDAEVLLELLDRGARRGDQTELGRRDDVRGLGLVVLVLDSPTICSTRSSMVTRPSVPPYSSTTSAMWMRVDCMRISRFVAGIDGGT